MASCLCSLSNRKWPPLRCCCRLKAHRLARRLKPPFWSQRTESRQRRRETAKGGHGAEVRDSLVVVMAKEQRGEDGREGERIKTWGSFVHQGDRVPARVCSEATRGAGRGPCYGRDATSQAKETLLKPIYLNRLFRQGGGGLKETGPI